MTTRYTKDHEWVRMEGDVAVVGITPYAAEQLGDVVFVELPDVGKVVKAGADMAVVESAKAASDVYAPIGGSVAAVNEALAGSPQLVNESADGEGWFVKIKPDNPGELDALMDAAAYADYVRGL
ncbi:MAG: glycine cleavage system protein GcvH [Hydrogenophilaceae bacterium]|jgi:glycine cleavage system H protein|nr:glycine cleavage system protein GcvH [Hydrogenophilaceae bacterium]